MAPTAPDPALAARAAAFDAAWLSGRRWFRSKSRPIAAVAPLDAARMDAAPLDTARLAEGAWLLVLGVEYADGGSDRYLVPAVEDGARLREPRDGEGAWRALAGHVLAGAALHGTAGTFSFSPTSELQRLVPGGAAQVAGLSEERHGGEQSNTSVWLGGRLALKLYRRLEAGVNPEVEVNAFLTAAGFPHAPALAGSVDYRDAEGQTCAIAMLQQLVPARADGWSWMLDCLARPPGGPREALAGVARIGRITAQMHDALASRPDAPGFPARAATADELAGWRDGAEVQLREAIAAVSEPELERLRSLAPVIRDRFGGIDARRDAAVSRIHGDYHLGQLLRTDDGFAVIDFEGEPARPLAARRAPASPLRDVAGMLRSFDYAARTAERQGSGALDCDAWQAAARRAFTEAYGTARIDPPLLAALEAEKACYEVVYEANNRPDWTWLPLEALGRIAGASA